MRKLIRIALGHKKHGLLVCLTFISMLLVTLSSQMEIFSVGILTKKGPDFFELMGSQEEGAFVNAETVSKEMMDKRFIEIQDPHTRMVTLNSANHWLEQQKKNDLFYRGYHFFDQLFEYSKDYKALVFLILVVALFRAITLFLHRLTTRLLAIRVSQDLREKYFRHIQTLPIEFYHRYHMGSLSARVLGDASMVSESINSCLTNYIQTPFTVVTTLSLCFLTSWQLSLIIFFGFPLIVFPILFLAKKIKKIAKELQKNQEGFTSVLIDFLSGIQTIKLFAMETFTYQKYKEQNDAMAKLETKAARYDVSSRPIIHTIGMSFLGFALMWGLYVLELSVSEVLVYCGFLYIFYEPIKKFAEENANIQKGVAAFERMEEVMKIKPAIIDLPDAIPLQTFQQEVSFKDVWFKYQDSWVLKGVSFTIQKGEKVAIIGPTGAGKSTICQLVPRLYEVQKGVITIDGQPINRYTQQSLREQIGFVPQKSFLFWDTVAENLSFGKAFTLEEIKRAARLAHADEFIERLPNRYGSFLDEAGKNLSGGQQQRLAIARAILKNAPILILDEATSSLDTISENHIKEALTQLRGQVTQIIIAHRLSTVEDADKIVLLDKGELVAIGDKETLLRESPLFQKMWELYTPSTSVSR